MTPGRRRRAANHAPIHGEREFVLYWMVAARRPTWSFALDQAIAYAEQLKRPLVVLEALRLDYPFASPRLHQFVLDGMADNERTFARSPIRHLSYVETQPGAGRGLLESLARRACVVISDDWPSFFLPRAQRAVAKRLDVRLELVDGNGIAPLSASPREFPTAYTFRRWFQARASDFLAEAPRPDPLRGLQLPDAGALAFEGPWQFGLPADGCDALPLDRRVPIVSHERGGHEEAQRRLRGFLATKLARYASDRNDVTDPATSAFSAHLHFGHLSAHEVVAALLADGDFDREALSDRPARGAREGWWGLDPAREAFLDQLVVWRELGHHFAHHRLDDMLQLESLPPWAQNTLGEHWDDRRPWVYTLEQFERAATHDPIWNAAQRELIETGRIHNYLRMLWGKKILHWSENPQAALDIMITLNDRWALDGRDPNSYSGIFWILGRFDRPWGPRRPVFGTVRYMSSDNTRRKLRLGPYLARFGAERELFFEEQSR